MRNWSADWSGRKPSVGQGKDVVAPPADRATGEPSSPKQPERIYDLKALGKITARNDGARLLFHRDVLDAYLRAGA